MRIDGHEVLGSSRCLLEEASESAKAVARGEMRDWALGEILAAQAKTGFTAEADFRQLTIGRGPEGHGAPAPPGVRDPAAV